MHCVENVCRCLFCDAERGVVVARSWVRACGELLSHPGLFIAWPLSRGGICVCLCAAAGQFAIQRQRARRLLHPSLPMLVVELCSVAAVCSSSAEGKLLGAPHQ
jgi:hypothetical protein